ncbi:hypothetical protein PG999_007963 [Apiospora kogelbergensis]|uniref:RelA/SpoT domain-containing protein n=2 Tax=Apiospora kogelbergensis TaxID=1337665 RepID=A0AAW0QUH9_9PEZI
MPIRSGLNPSLLEDFEKAYKNEKTLVRHDVNKIISLLEDRTTGLRSRQILHIPITSRIKKKKSAIGSLVRRQEARHYHAELKKRLEGHNESWGEYWANREQKHHIDDIGPFCELREMYQALHDIGGIRICVYFPGDVENVVAFLKERPEIDVERIVLRGQGDAAPDILQLEQYLTNRDNDASKLKQWREDIRRPPNYRATHVIAKLKGGSNGTQGNPIVVEIQIATVVMHAWSQIEHDIVYKPNPETPKVEQRVLEGILDTFNSVAKTGESALAQLENYRHFMAEHRSENERNLADNAYEFGIFLFNTCKERSLSPFTDSSLGACNWNYLDQLFKVLRATEDHNMLRLQTLLCSFIKRKDSNAQSVGCDLPVHLMREIYELEVTQRFKVRMSSKVQDRALAVQVVHCFNIAACLGIEEDFMAALNETLPPMDERPSLADMLDFVHPHHPRLNTHKREQITNFCEAFLDRKRLKQSSFKRDRLKLAVLELPILLSEVGYIVLEAESSTNQHEDPFIFPRKLCQLLPDDEGTHWVPELLRVARILASFERESLRTKRQGHTEAEDNLYMGVPQPTVSEEPSKVLRSSHHIVSKYSGPLDDNYKMIKTAINDMLKRGKNGCSCRVPVLNSETQSFEYEHELNPRCHHEPNLGYFKSRKLDPDDELPAWAFVEGRRQLRDGRLKRTNIEDIRTHPEIVTASRSDNAGSGFQELIQATERMEPGCQLRHITDHIDEDRGHVNEFCFTLHDYRFCMLLCQRKFTLKPAKYDREETQQHGKESITTQNHAKRGIDEDGKSVLQLSEGSIKEPLKRRRLQSGISSAKRSV